MSELLRSVLSTKQAKGKGVVYDRLGDSEDAALEKNDPLQVAEDYALKRSLERKIFYLKISTAILSALLLLSLLSHTSLTPLKSTTAHRVSSPLPSLSSKEVIFNQDPILSLRPDPLISDPAWDSLLPPGRGFVYIPNASAYDLPAGELTPYGDIYSITVFHQLHCLGQMRRFTWMFLDSITQPNATTKATMQEAVVKMFDTAEGKEHLGHCFDYLRQGLMCNADLSVEWPRTELDGRRFAVDGWGIPHQCKNWDEVMTFMDANHFNMSTESAIAPLGGASG